MVYPALLPLMCTTRLPVVDWTDAPCRFKWTRPFSRKKKSGFCACAITFQTQSTFSLLVPNILLNALFLNTLNLRSFRQCEQPLFTPIQKKRQNYSSVYFFWAVGIKSTSSHLRRLFYLWSDPPSLYKDLYSAGHNYKFTLQFKNKKLGLGLTKFFHVVSSILLFKPEFCTYFLFV